MSNLDPWRNYDFDSAFYKSIPWRFMDFISVYNEFYSDDYRRFNYLVDFRTLKEREIMLLVSSELQIAYRVLAEAKFVYDDLFSGVEYPIPLEESWIAGLRPVKNWRDTVTDEGFSDRSIFKHRIDKLIESGYLKKTKLSVFNNIDSNLYGLWEAAVAADGVPEEMRVEIIADLRKQVARAIRPKWADRLDYKQLRTLTAPHFLKEVHKPDIGKDGSVSTEVIRAIDPTLMRAVEFYISQRKRRNVDLGDAEGLTFIMERPRNPQKNKPPFPAPT